MLNETNLLLKEYLFDQLGKPSDTVVDFSFHLPSKDWLNQSDSSKNWINIYLLELKGNLDLRENSWEREEKINDTVDKKKPPLFVDLFYLITFYNKDKKTDLEHSYLESVLISLYDFKNLAPSNNNIDQAILNKIDLEIFPKPFIDENVSYQLWSALNQDARPYIPLKITLPLESKVKMTEKIVKEDGKIINLGIKPLKEE